MKLTLIIFSFYFLSAQQQIDIKSGQKWVRLRPSVLTVRSLITRSNTTKQKNMVLRIDNHVNDQELKMKTLVSWPLQKSSGLCKGSMTSSFNVSLTFSSAPISSNVTPISLGGITSARSLFSNSFSVTISWVRQTIYPQINMSKTSHSQIRIASHENISLANHQKEGNHLKWLLQALAFILHSLKNFQSILNAARLRDTKQLFNTTNITAKQTHIVSAAAATSITSQETIQASRQDPQQGSASNDGSRPIQPPSLHLHNTKKREEKLNNLSLCYKSKSNDKKTVLFPFCEYHMLT